MSDRGKSTASRKVPAGVDKFSFGSKIIGETLTIDLKNSMIAYSPGAGHNVMARRHGSGGMAAAAWDGSMAACGKRRSRYESPLSDV